MSFRRLAIPRKRINDQQYHVYMAFRRNGVSSGEALDLFKYIGTERIHVHSFGNRYSHAPFTIPVSTDEIILLQPGKRGEGKYDYEVLKW